MAQLDKSEPSTPEVQQCTVLDLAAHAAAQQKSARGTLSELADQGRSCAPIPKFESTDDLLAAYKRGKANGAPDMVAFELLGKGDSNDYVKDSIGSLENAMGYGSNLLDYMWFKDDNGNAQVFILGKRDSSDTPELAQAKDTDKTTSSCVALGDTVDTNLDRQLRLPLNTTEVAANKIHTEREHEAQLASIGIAISTPADQVEQINKQRSDLLDSLRPEPNASQEDMDRFAAQSLAVGVGLPPNTDAGTVQQTIDSYKQQAEALRLGLSQGATADQIKDANAEVNNAVNENTNLQERLPPGTTVQESVKIFSDRARQSDLAREGIDPTLSSAQVNEIRTQRQQAASALSAQLADNPDMPTDQRQALTVQIDAAKLGLPQTSTAEDVDTARQTYQRQSSALLMGLPKDATQAEIDAARQASDALELQSIPQNLCSVEPNTAQN